MAMHSLEQKVFMVLGCLVSACQALVLCRAWYLLGWQALIRALKIQLHMETSGMQDKDHQLEKLVVQTCTRYRHRIAYALLFILQTTLMLLISIGTVKRLFGWPGWMSEMQDVVALAAAACGLSLGAFRREWNRKSLDVFFLFGMLFLTLFLSSPACPEPHAVPMHVRHFLFVSRICAGLVPSRPSLAFFANIASSIFISSSYMGSFVLENSLELVMATFFISRMRYHSEQLVRTQLKALSSDKHLSAATLLLDATCDAVVVLDSEFRFAAESCKFKSMMLHGDGTSLVGRRFFDFCREDQFERLRLPSESTAACIVEHVLLDLKDSLNTKVSVEAFHVWVDDVHYIGLKESSNDVHMPEPSLPQDSLSGTFIPYIQDAEDEQGSMSVWFNVESLEVVRSSQAWASFCGSSSFCCLLEEWFSPDDLFVVVQSRFELEYSGNTTGELDGQVDLGSMKFQVSVPGIGLGTTLTVIASVAVCSIHESCGQRAGVDTKKVKSLKFTDARVAGCHTTKDSGHLRRKSTKKRTDKHRSSRIKRNSPFSQNDNNHLDGIRTRKSSGGSNCESNSGEKASTNSDSSSSSCSSKHFSSESLDRNPSSRSFTYNSGSRNHNNHKKHEGSYGDGDDHDSIEPYHSEADDPDEASCKQRGHIQIDTEVLTNDVSPTKLGKPALKENSDLEQISLVQLGPMQTSLAGPWHMQLHVHSNQIKL